MIYAASPLLNCQRWGDVSIASQTSFILAEWINNLLPQFFGFIRNLAKLARMDEEFSGSSLLLHPEAVFSGRMDE